MKAKDIHNFIELAREEWLNGNVSKLTQSSIDILNNIIDTAKVLSDFMEWVDDNKSSPEGYFDYMQAIDAHLHTRGNVKVYPEPFPKELDDEVQWLRPHICQLK